MFNIVELVVDLHKVVDEMQCAGEKRTLRKVGGCNGHEYCEWITLVVVYCCLVIGSSITI
jgi:hypothetical protein